MPGRMAKAALGAEPCAGRGGRAMCRQRQPRPARAAIGESVLGLFAAAPGMPVAEFVGGLSASRLGRTVVADCVAWEQLEHSEEKRYRLACRGVSVFGNQWEAGDDTGQEGRRDMDGGRRSRERQKGEVAHAARRRRAQHVGVSSIAEVVRARRLSLPPHFPRITAATVYSGRFEFRARRQLVSSRACRPVPPHSSHPSWSPCRSS